MLDVFLVNKLFYDSQLPRNTGSELRMDFPNRWYGVDKNDQIFYVSSPIFSPKVGGAMTDNEIQKFYLFHSPTVHYCNF